MSELPTNYTDEVNSLLNNAYRSRINNLQKSIQLAKQALAVSRQQNDVALVGNSLNKLSLFYMIRGAYKRAVAMAKEAIKSFEVLGDEKGIADAKYCLAGVYYKTDNYHLGLVNLIDCLSTYKRFNDYHNIARTHKSLATIYEYLCDQKNALRSYESAIDAARKVKDTDLIANVYNPLSGIYLKQGKIVKATRVIEQSIAIKHRTGDVRGMAFALYGRGKINLNQQRFPEAEQDFLKAIEIHQQMGERLGTGMAYYKLSKLYVAMGEAEMAKNILAEALLFSEKYNTLIIKFKCNHLLYQIHKGQNNSSKALEHLEYYMTQREAVINTQTRQVIENYELMLQMESVEKEAHMEREKAEMIKKHERAEQSAKMKQDFLSTMSHEIRTPLNAVVTISSLLSDRDNDEERQLLDSLRFASNNLLLLINDILDFNKLDNGRMQLENRPCNLHVLMQHIKKTYVFLATEKGLKPYLFIDPLIAEAYELDETKLAQILGNLISNAIKYTDEGKVVVELLLMASHDEIDTIKFRVTDTGVGIPKEYYGEMFESFSQPKSITTRKQGGSGLGLAIVKKLVELHGSQVHFKSEVGKGSEFYFELQLKRARQSEQAPTKTKQQLHNRVALLAEDNMINAMVARKLLSNWGITAEHAVNGLDAIDKAWQKTFDFILMDIHMPEMNGFDATAHIRNNDNPNIKTPIFALTADITAEGQEQYLNYFTGFLRKPIEIDKLYKALLEVC
ncbi:tetratricopeptide repeat protein [Mucilaginibacter sp. Bleaf8]|uniref:tetratricopeptide repeat-containing hybrid sensor histidine kinase/response regulator n=1 Tax=Mucilaginibacter sp. Bleaf8 TaxID=2834430 RepID=UPI001BCBE03D|nr:ATP-binding protein [Mucilaginibacter sp. Bleaf8]MBS7563585.1 tetratricopeptide repeat protein [Mucilaginibacter sp. Bleaf8]